MTCLVSDIADRIADEILTVGASGRPIKCNRAVMMKGKYPDGEKDMGGRNHASIAMVIREHLLAAGFPSNPDVWRPVSFAADCTGAVDGDEPGPDCGLCGQPYDECPCPGPTQDHMEYQVIDGVLMAHPEQLDP